MPISVAAPRHRVRGHAVQPEAGEQQRQRAEEPRQHRHHAILRQRLVDLIGDSGRNVTIEIAVDAAVSAAATLLRQQRRRAACAARTADVELGLNSSGIAVACASGM